MNHLSKWSVFSVLALSFAFFPGRSARANDNIVARGGYVDVIRKNPNTEKETIQFQICIESLPCRALAKGRWFTRAELDSQKMTEAFQIFFSALGDVGVIAVPAVLGMVAGRTLTESFFGLIGGTAAGGFSLVFLTAVDALNPAEQYRQMSLISSDVLDDVDETFSGSIFDIEERLEKVLASV
jgi:hypothetical protein